MSKMDKFLEHEPRAMSEEELMAEIEQEEDSHFCDLEALCYGLHGIDAWEFDEDGNVVRQVYTCGFIIAGTVWGCPRRRRLLREI